MTLILHRGAEPCDINRLQALPTPPRTQTHVPLPHCELVSMVKYALGYHGHDVEAEHYGVTPDGNEFFGLMTLKSPYGNYSDTLGLRNSHSKRFPIGIAYGSRVMVCDNLSFIGDQVIRRKHTTNSKRDLPGLVAGVIEPLREKRQAQQITFQAYQATRLADSQADHAIVNMYRHGVINIQRLPEVLGQWENPAHDWGEKSVWRLFNAATFALTGKVSEDPSVTRRLHDVLDNLCAPVIEGVYETIQ